jgi:hypothetical protein
MLALSPRALGDVERHAEHGPAPRRTDDLGIHEETAQRQRGRSAARSLAAIPRSVIDQPFVATTYSVMRSSPRSGKSGNRARRSFSFTRVTWRIPAVTRAHSSRG